MGSGNRFLRKLTIAMAVIYTFYYTQFFSFFRFGFCKQLSLIMEGQTSRQRICYKHTTKETKSPHRGGANNPGAGIV